MAIYPLETDLTPTNSCEMNKQQVMLAIYLLHGTDFNYKVCFTILIFQEVRSSSNFSSAKKTKENTYVHGFI